MTVLRQSVRPSPPRSATVLPPTPQRARGTASLGDVGAAIARAELARLLAGAPAAPSAGAFREVPAPPAAAGPGGPSEGIGRSIARAVDGALGGRR
jgi:hypothetical protein